MDREGKILRVGTAVILCAVLLRLAETRLPAIEREDIVKFFFFLQTGRQVSFYEPSVSVQAKIPPETSPPETVAQTQPAPKPLILGPEDEKRVTISDHTDSYIDVMSLLEQPQNWQLRQEKPTVLILHSHGTESYVNLEAYEESADYRTRDPDYNMLSVGKRLTECLEAGGVRVIHDDCAYDTLSYSGAYTQARAAVQTHLTENPSICLVLDLHRDAMTDENGEQIGYHLDTPRGTAARLMLVVGSDLGGLDFPNWRENLALATKLQVALERETPGICRPLALRTGRYNQDLFPAMVLVEVGAAGNTRQEALLAAELLAEAILSVAEGIVYET